jgi:hypothetical protein
MPLGQVTQRVTDMVREMVPKWRYRLSPQEAALGPHLRSNDALLEALTGLITERIKGRELKEVPSDPILCMASMARDKELRWVISRLEHVYNSPAASEVQDGEQPE